MAFLKVIYVLPKLFFAVFNFKLCRRRGFAYPIIIFSVFHNIAGVSLRAPDDGLDDITGTTEIGLALGKLIPVKNVW